MIACKLSDHAEEEEEGLFKAPSQTTEKLQTPHAGLRLAKGHKRIASVELGRSSSGKIS